MRIIAGSARRTQLEIAEDSTTRPFLEKARGALFNSLGDRVCGAKALDLYAGSGALGLEALSRGAESCCFVERNARAYAALLRNIGKCGMSAQASPLRSDVAGAVVEMTGEFDIIFVDPPFPELAEWLGNGGADAIMREASRILAVGGCLVFRMEDGKAKPPGWPGLSLDSIRRYGRSLVCRYGKEATS